MQIQAYLDRIAYQGSWSPDLDTLYRLQKQHLLSIPFENLDIHIPRAISLGEDQLFEKIVEQKRGGFCYELNGLFAFLLQKLGYDCTLISARVGRADGSIGQEFDHLALMLKIQDQWHLVDVGFGDFTMEPLPFVLGEVIKTSDGLAFFFEAIENQRYKITRQATSWSEAKWYTFSLTSRQLNDFEAMCQYHQTSPKSHFTLKSVCSLATEEGRITLSDKRLNIRKGNDQEETLLENKLAFEAALKKYFHIEL